ncbi:enoyl-CoA hydratase/isomerase family protein [Microbacterium immunditiarum]|uniref:2-(1,2-epoxy-1,2-dihydrophenyl)acetyl-CoA isomerase n=1 Tax=Microbacterium immunditiarum TaxID=337480 RepID=A0A7Y9KII7_9MICO|nr:enoyl-CoA hydratase/isomerase family protein [Microbacterium immunditiarum]NYE18820.1 2-(1,2-epoxy-1,2-dihydrophenyl)acetyl-CoA isomerase [Microbacterium immunditiarum]
MTADAARVASAPHVRVSRDGHIVRIALARPEAANTVNLAMARALLGELERLVADPPRVLIIEGEGGVFCGGGDVREMAAADDVTAYLHDLAGTFHAALLTLDDIDCVTIAAVDGAAAGGGLGLALAADVVIATERSRFLTAYEKLGVTPDSGVTHRLARAVGSARALSMTVLSRPLDAATAHAWGIVADVVAADALASAIDGLAAELASRPTSHIAATRRLIRQGETTTLDAQLRAEASGIARSAAQPHALAAIRAFAPQRAAD